MVTCVNPSCGILLDNYRGLNCPNCGLESEYSAWLPVYIRTETLRIEDPGFEEEWTWMTFYDDWQSFLHYNNTNDSDNDYDYWPDNASTDSDFCFDLPDEIYYQVDLADFWCEQCGFCDHETEDGHWDGPEDTILPFYNVLLGTCKD